jgi:hypothetical protein
MLCPLCGGKLIRQPTIAEDLYTFSCPFPYKNDKGEIASRHKCGYIAIRKNGNLIHEQWNSLYDKRKKEKKQ